MSGEQNHRNTGLLVIVILLALFCSAGGILLYFWQPAPAGQTQSAYTMPEPETTAAVTTTQTTAPETTSETVVTTEPDPHAPYLDYLENTLMPEYGSADSSAALPCSEQSGIAGVFFDDLRDTGSDDMVVIRLDVTYADCAALPVLLWYGESDGEVTLLDTFEVKPQCSAYCIRRADKALYLSGEYLGNADDPDTWQCMEIALSFRPDPDLTMENMKQDIAASRPAVLYPDDAELLLEMQLDTAQPLTPLTDRRYLLRSYMEALPS